MQLLASDDRKQAIQKITSPPREEFNIFSKNSLQKIIQDYRPTHVLHLAWSSTGSSQYEKDNSHFQWADATYSLVKKLSDEGVISWVVGTGLESTELELDTSPYGEAKLKLKSEILSLDDFCSRWISMPYVVSMYHRRP